MHETSFSHLGTADMKRSNLSLAAAGLKVTDLDDTLVGRVGLEASADTMARLKINGNQQNGGMSQRQELTTRQQYVEQNERRTQEAYGGSNNYLTAGGQQEAISYDHVDGAYALEGGSAPVVEYGDARDRTYSRSTLDNVFTGTSVASGQAGYAGHGGQAGVVGTGISTAVVGTGISTGIVAPTPGVSVTGADGSLTQPLNYAGTQSITLLPDEVPRAGEAIHINVLKEGTLASPRSTSMASTSGGQTFRLDGGSVSHALDTTPGGSMDNLAYTTDRIDTVVLE